MQKHILKITVLMVGIILLCHAQFLRAQDAGVMMSGGDINGKNYMTIIHFSDITNAPIWATNEDNPPLAVRRAEQLAVKALGDSVGSKSEWTPDSITLKHGGKGHWVYQIQLFGAPTNMPPDEWKSGVTVFVTMSGKVFLPKPWPRK
jgi:hypothetical protein